jgi:HlyD family secretion protein
VYVERYLGRKGLERQVLVEQLAQAQAQLALAEHDLKLTEIRSPVDGVVLERRDKGDRYLAAGEPLLLVGNLDDMEVVADVLTQDALRLAPGSSVSLEPASGRKPIPGNVKRIEPAGFTKLSSLGVEEQRVKVIVSVEGPRRGLGVGYRLQARFFTGEKTNALIVPRFSVLQAPDRSFYVFKVEDGSLKKQPVKLGLRSDLQLEIVEGLSENDLIAARPSSSMEDGMKVSAKSGAVK